MKSILIFEKWTKINVQILVAEKVLTAENFRFCILSFIVLNQIIKFLFVIEKKLTFYLKYFIEEI
jgi:hypothetical protein